MSAHYVYRCYDKTDRLIYVGFTGNPAQRFDFHKINTWWAHQVEKVRVKSYSTKHAARAAERHAIATENPRWNSFGKWAQHTQWDEQDFRDYLTVFRNRAMHLTAHNRTHLANVHRIYESRFGHPLSLELANQ